NYLHWCLASYPVEQGEGAPVHSPLGFDLTVTSLYPPLLTGRRVEMLSGEPRLAALGDALMGGSRYSLVKLTPAHLQALVRLQPERLSNVSAHALVIGGEALPAESLQL